MSRQEMGPETPTPRGDGQELRTPTVTRERSTTAGPVTWEEMRTLLRGEPATHRRRLWRPVTGGTLAMIAGIWNVIVGAGILLGSLALDVVSPSFLWEFGDFALIGTAAGILLIVTGVVATIGGFLAIRRRAWGLALIGVIMALAPSPVILPFIMGVLAVIFVAQGRPEFRHDEETM